MNSLLQHIRQNTQTPTGLTLVIGAGNGASLPALRRLGSSRLVLAEAQRNGARLPVTALVDQFYGDVQHMGGKRWDTSSLIKRLR